MAFPKNFLVDSWLTITIVFVFLCTPNKTFRTAKQSIFHGMGFRNQHTYLKARCKVLFPKKTGSKRRKNWSIVDFPEGLAIYTYGE